MSKPSNHVTRKHHEETVRNLANSHAKALGSLNEEINVLRTQLSRVLAQNTESHKTSLRLLKEAQGGIRRRQMLIDQLSLEIASRSVRDSTTYEDARTGMVVGHDRAVDEDHARVHASVANGELRQ